MLEFASVSTPVRSLCQRKVVALVLGFHELHVITARIVLLYVLV